MERCRFQFFGCQIHVTYSPKLDKLREACDYEVQCYIKAYRCKYYLFYFIYIMVSPEPCAWEANPS